jgi:hypothetical protein
MEKNPTQAMVIGLERLQSYINKKADAFNTIKIMDSNNSKLSRDQFIKKDVDENIQDLIEHLQEFSPEYHKVWWIALLNGSQEITRFSFSAKPMTNMIGGIQNGLDPEFVNRLVEAEKKAAIAEYQMSEMARELLEDDDDDDEDDNKNDWMGAITEQVMPQIIPMIPQLLGSIIENLKKDKPTLSVGAIPDEANDLVESLLQNGVTIEHLRKLANMAQNEKIKFKSLLLML